MLIALIPAIAWGSVGLISGKLGGSANQQTLGMTWGALLFSILMTVFTWQHFTTHTTVKLWIVGIVSGFFWSIGQNQQFHAMKAVGISKAVPISTGAQLVANALAGALLFHEWTTVRQLTLGTIALIVLVVGSSLTALRDKTAIKKVNENWSVGYRAMLLSTLGYLGYTVIVTWANVDTQAMVLPQAMGMVVGATIFAYGQNIFQTETFKNMLTGLVWGTGNFFMFLATTTVGLAISFSFSQMGIVISTFGSILFLGEKKTRKEMGYVIIGSLLVIVGGILLGQLK
ncbi:GRP family sugar transporter [Ligilactobacillus sp. WILCCON 0076]|uniref:GRP family sugar transporter n=1 Tax=Ligilactobacillus ubinensis TaxID=2876789 RepID=A0A9X2JLP6_9LACO|nr:GRP family sugar transporter [Ligilactobacillus ubinensis]MCP0886291.1 GRP family sugar transporter [Ligilactobacillus ubinensis]